MNKIETTLSVCYPVTYSIGKAIDYIGEVTDVTKNILKPYDCINLWCRGSSGAILAGLFADRILKLFPDKDVHIAHVKKPQESAHSMSPFPIGLGKSVSIIIDDFISSGNTINSITDYIRKNEYAIPTILIVSQINCDSKRINHFIYFDYVVTNFQDSYQ